VHPVGSCCADTVYHDARSTKH